MRNLLLLILLITLSGCVSTSESKLKVVKGLDFNYLETTCVTPEESRTLPMQKAIEETCKGQQFEAAVELLSVFNRDEQTAIVRLPFTCLLKRDDNAQVQSY